MIIGLTGYSGVGKSAVAIEIQKILFDQGYNCVIVAFADALKQLAKDIGWNGLKDAKGRKLLQVLGTEVCRNCIDKDYWVKLWAERVADYIEEDPDIWVIADDVRFDNEVHAVRKLGGKVFLLKRESIAQQYSHPSENIHSLKGIDVIVDNSDIIWPASRILYHMRDGKAEVKDGTYN